MVKVETEEPTTEETALIPNDPEPRGNKGNNKLYVTTEAGTAT